MLGTALADLLVHVFAYLEGMETPLAIILTAAFGILGGYLVQPQHKADVAGDKEPPVYVPPHKMGPEDLEAKDQPASKQSGRRAAK